MNDIQDLKRMIGEAVEHIRSKSAIVPRVGIICGTGMGALADKVESATVIPYDEIPHFPVSTVESHHGNLALGRLAGQNVFVMQGRFHFYEGYSMRQITFPERVMKALGCDTMIVMNATGSMNPFIGKGSIVFIHDQINMMGQNPLVGPNDDSLGPRFPDMSEPYSRALVNLAETVALEKGIKLQKGVYLACPGPSLETRAEYRMMRGMGADVVGMSTVPEVIVAVHGGMDVLAFSVITDECFPDALEAVQIEKIIATAAGAEPKLTELVGACIERMPV